MSAAHITVTVSAEDAAKIIEQYAEEVRQIVAQRDELLAVLLAVRKDFHGVKYADDLSCDWWGAMESAIAKATTPAGTGPANNDAHP